MYNITKILLKQLQHTEFIKLCGGISKIWNVIFLRVLLHRVVVLRVSVFFQGILRLGRKLEGALLEAFDEFGKVISLLGHAYKFVFEQVFRGWALWALDCESLRNEEFRITHISRVAL